MPALQDPTDSLKGGYWAEGWNYGQMAAENLLAGISGQRLPYCVNPEVYPAASARQF